MYELHDMDGRQKGEVMNSISLAELMSVMRQLDSMRKATAWYQFIQKFRYKVILTTLLGLIEWILENSNKRNCGTNHSTN